MKFSTKFIKANDKVSSFEEFVPAPYFRKTFELDFKPENAEITICGLGFYELYINGTNVTKGPLAPYINNPDDILYYDNYDITELLNEGTNAIGVILGNGFRNAYGGFVWDFDKSTSRGPVTFALALEAKDNDKVFELEADETFKTHSSPILYDDLRMGYCYDSRLEIPDWNTCDFDDSDWQYAMAERTPRGYAKLCEVEPIVVTKEIKAVEIKHYDRLGFAHNLSIEGNPPLEETYRDNVYVYDFGVNTAGVTCIKINGKPGQKITVRHAESLVRGEFSVNSTIFHSEKSLKKYLDYGQTDVFICKGGEETFIPKFKYDGFRYAYVEGLEDYQATKEAVTYLEMHSDFEQRGDFECSCDTINALQECSHISDLSNFFYFPTDCPHREKNGWTADAWLSSEHMLINYTVEKSLREWLCNIRSVQRIDGALPGIIPTGGWGFEWGNGPVWDAVCVEIPYSLYKYTGDKEVIKENASMIMRYLYYVSSMRDEKGLTGFGLGDWCDPFESNEHPISAPLDVVASIATYNIAKKSAFLFSQVGLSKESEYAKTFAEEMRQSIRENLVDFSSMTVDGDCQTSQAMGIAHGIFNDDEIERANSKLLEIIHRDGDINACGVIGIRYIYHVLSSMGESELAYKIVTSESRSCYGYWIKNKATALCESFGEFDVAWANSKNHHFFGDISSWFVQSIAGLKPNPNADDISCYEISPSFIGDLTFAKAYHTSVYGKTSVNWERTENGNIKLCVDIPEGIHGKVVLPKGYCFENSKAELDLTSGVSEWEIKY